MSLRLAQNSLMLINTILVERAIEQGGLMGTPRHGGFGAYMHCATAYPLMVSRTYEKSETPY